MIAVIRWGGFGDVFQWGWSKTTGWAEDRILDSLQSLLVWITTVQLTGVAWVMTMIGKAMGGLEGSGIGDSWYVEDVFAPMQVVGVSLAVLALTWGIVSAAWSRKGWVVLKRMSIQVIKWMFLTFFCLQGTQMLMDLTAEFEYFLITGATGRDATNLFDAYGKLAEVAPDGNAFSALLLLLIAMIMMLVGILILLVLFIRDAALMLVLLFAPVVALLLLTPHAKAVSKYVNKVIALVLLKFIMMAGLALGSTAILATTGVGNTFVAAPPPSEPTASIAVLEDAAESEAVGTLMVQMLSGLAVMVMALVMPAFIASVLPDGMGDSGVQSGMSGGARNAIAMKQRHEQVQSARESARQRAQTG